MEDGSSSLQRAVAPGGLVNGSYLWPGQNLPMEDGSYSIPFKEGFREVPQAKIPSSVLSHIRQETHLSSSGASISNEQDQKTTRIRRPYMTISHLQTPQYTHFNSHGEAILPQHFPVNNGINRPEPPRLCPSCFSTNLSIGGHCSNCRSTATVVDCNPGDTAPRIFGIGTAPSPPPPSPSSSTDFAAVSKVSKAWSTQNDISPRVPDVKKMHVDAQGNMGSGSLEFSYPVVLNIKPPVNRIPPDSHRYKPGELLPGRQNTLPKILISPPRLGGPPSFTNNVNIQSPNPRPGPTKRQKLSHPSVRKTSASHPLNTAMDHTDKSTINYGCSLKICSSSKCTGIISSSSSATRCLPCVRQDWKSRRKLAAAKPPAPFRKIYSSNEQEDHGGVAGKGQKKCVPWADDNVQHHSSPAPPNRSAPEGWLKSADIITPSDTPIDNNIPNLNLTGSVDDLTHSERIRKRSENDVIADQLGIDMECSAPPLSISKDDFSKPVYISGWDSDLSELSESTEADVNLGSPSKLEIKSSSGLKIRIPARPASAFSKKCASKKCEQTLGFGYRWKLCLICRAQMREVNRKKRTFASLHQSPLEVLTDNENMGTPLSMDLQKHIDQVKLVQGARLCAVKSCTYIIPPISEYNGKRCTLCVLRRTERKHLEKETDQRPSGRSKLVSQPSFWLQQLDHTRTDTGDESGRCHRYGCGMFSDSSPSRECRQCVGRRQWLTNKFTGQTIIPDGPVILHHGSRKPLYRPRGLSPYPKYKSFLSALKDFKDLLTGFLRVQSIFFLFNQSRSSNAFFAFDAEYSIVVLAFDLDKRRGEVAANILKLKTSIEYVGRIKFDPKSLISILEGGGISIRFSCMYPVPMLEPKAKDGETIINSFLKFMQCELEIAVVPDYSHSFLPGQRTVIRFRLFG